MSGKIDKIYDVVIVGLGPVGGVLANILGQAGISVLVAEREASAYPLPRAVHYDDETMRVFQSVGVADHMAGKARVNPGMRFFDKNDNLLLDWPRPMKVGPFGWHPSYRFHQPDLEAALNEAVLRFDNVTVMRNTTVTSVSQSEDNVTLDVQQQDASFSVCGRYVIGCDGAKSIIRQSIGSQMIDYGFHERWLVVDIILQRPRPDLGDETIQVCNPERPSTYVRCPLDRRRWEISLHDGEDDQTAVTDDFVWGQLAPKVTPDDAVLERRAVYQFASKLADKWRLNRLMIAGDAAHLMPPFMGQGMCTGIRDVGNLGWKLISVLRDGVDDAILDSYASERAVHAETYIKTTMNLGALMNSCETAESLRSAIDPKHGTAKMASIIRDLGPGLAAADDAQGGVFFAQPDLVDGTKMDDYAAGRFIVATSKPVSVNETLCAVLNPDDEPGLAAALQSFHLAGAIIRPDGYLLASFDEAPTQAQIDAAYITAGLGKIVA